MTNIDWLTVEQAAAEAQVSTKTIRRWYRSGRLQADRLSPRVIRIRRCELAAMVERVA
ncbi:helix-turn-helix domain-containing protein [Gordonia jinhuaensis]